MQAALDEFTQMVPPTVQACAYTNIGLSFFVPSILWLVAPTLGVTFAVTMVTSSIGVHHLYESCKNGIDEKNQPFFQALELLQG